MMNPFRCLALAVAALAAACAIERPAERAAASPAVAQPAPAIASPIPATAPSAPASVKPADASQAATAPKTTAPGKAAPAAAPKAAVAPKAAAKEAPKAAPPKVASAKPEAPRKETSRAEAPKAPAAAPLDLTALEKRLRATPAIGTFTKLAIKNQVDDLIERFRAFHAGRERMTLAELRQPYNLLIMKVLSLLQDGDPPLAGDIAASREALWSVLADKSKFTTLQGNA